MTVRIRARYITIAVTWTVRVRTVNNTFRAYSDHACARSITPCFIKSSGASEPGCAEVAITGRGLNADCRPADRRRVKLRIKLEDPVRILPPCWQTIISRPTTRATELTTATCSGGSRGVRPWGDASPNNTYKFAKPEWVDIKLKISQLYFSIYAWNDLYSHQNSSKWALSKAVFFSIFVT